MRQSINFERQQISQLKQQNAQLNQRTTLLQKAKINQTATTLQISNLYANHKSVNDEINYLINCINQKNLCCCNVKPIKQKQTKNFSQIKNYVQFDLSGEFKNTFCFLKELEQSSQLLKIISCHLERANNQEHKINLHMTVKLFTEC
jgi:hypothetical protein